MMHCIRSWERKVFAKNSEKGLIEVAPLAYMRGRTLDNAFIILDEAQNTTPAQMKMFSDKDRIWFQSRDHRRCHPKGPSGRNGFRSGCSSQGGKKSGGDQHLHTDEQGCGAAPACTEDRKGI